MRRVALLAAAYMMCCYGILFGGEEADPKKADPAKAEEDAAKALKAAQAAQQELDAKCKAQAAEIGKLKEKVAQLEKELAAATAELAKRNAAEGAEAIVVDAAAQVKVEALIRGFKSTAAQRAKARDELVKIGKPAVPQLVKALKSDHPYVRLSAVRTLGEIEDRACVPGLIEALSDVDNDIVQAANKALMNVTREYFGVVGFGETEEERKEFIKKWTDWWQNQQEKKKEE